VKGLRLISPRRVEFVDLSRSASEISNDEVIVQIRLSSVSIASAMALYLGKIMPPKYPSILGYEALGIVVKVGSDVKTLTAGSRVLVPAGHDDLVICSAENVIAVPEDIEDDLALLLIIACDADCGVERTLEEPVGPIVVAGAGVLGLLSIFALHRRGFNDIDVIEPLFERRALAKKFGARHALSPENASMWLDSSFTYSFQCSDSVSAFVQLQRLTSWRGRIGVISDANDGDMPLVRDFHDKELTVIACSDEKKYKTFAPDFFNALRNGASEYLNLVYEIRVALEDLPDLFHTMTNYDPRPLKILVVHGSN
jgi:alcohol dehydrogenase